MIVTNKRLLISESCGDSNRYTLQGKTHQHDMYASRPVHVCPAYASCGSPCTWQPFTRRRQIWIDSTAPEKKGLPTQCIARRLTDPRVRTQLLSQASQWSRGRKPSSWRWPTTRFIGPISPACDRYVHYLLAGANRTVLNWHKWGLQPWRCRHVIYPLLDLPNQLSPLSPSGPARSLF
jgi:hypothetical protein